MPASVIDIASDGKIFANKSQPYSFTIPAAGGTAFSGQNLPNWLSINSSSGRSGTAPASLTGTFHPGLVSDMDLWLDANDIVQPMGTPVYQWLDKSGKRHDADVQGQPLLVAGTNGHQAIRLRRSGRCPLDFPRLRLYRYGLHHLCRCPLHRNRYERLIGSASRNFLFGYYGNRVARFHPEGWVNNGESNDNLWHLHAADINNAPDPIANFWVDGTLKVQTANGSNNNNYKPGKIAFKGNKLHNNQYANGEVSEILIFKRVLTQDERESIEGYLSQKYGLTHPQSSKDLTSPTYPAEFEVIVSSTSGLSSRKLNLSLLDLPALTAGDPTGVELSSAMANGQVTAIGDTVDATVKVYFGTTDGALIPMPGVAASPSGNSASGTSPRDSPLIPPTTTAYH